MEACTHGASYSLRPLSVGCRNLKWSQLWHSELYRCTSHTELQFFQTHCSFPAHRPVSWRHSLKSRGTQTPLINVKKTLQVLCSVSSAANCCQLVRQHLRFFTWIFWVGMSVVLVALQSAGRQVFREAAGQSTATSKNSATSYFKAEDNIESYNCRQSCKYRHPRLSSLSFISALACRN